MSGEWIEPFEKWYAAFLADRAGVLSKQSHARHGYAAGWLRLFSAAQRPGQEKGYTDRTAFPAEFEEHAAKRPGQGELAFICERCSKPIREPHIYKYCLECNYKRQDQGEVERLRDQLAKQLESSIELRNALDAQAGEVERLRRVAEVTRELLADYDLAARAINAMPQSTEWKNPLYEKARVALAALERGAAEQSLAEKGSK